jgi:hypothetical protein
MGADTNILLSMEILIFLSDKLQFHHQCLHQLKDYQRAIPGFIDIFH